MNLKRLLSFLIVPLLLTACPSGRNRADAPDLGKLPRTILSGEQGPFHVQGIAVDLERGYIYFSFTTKLLKMDLAGNLIGSVDGLTGHLGCLTMNPADGRVYGSLEYKDDAIGKGIRKTLDGESEGADQTGFYIAVFDVDRIVRPDMDAERDRVMTAVYVKEAVDDYFAETVNGGRTVAHRFGCSGIDGVTFAPRFGSGEEGDWLYVAYGIYGDTLRTDNDYQVLLAYDTKEWKRYEQPLSQSNLHKSGPCGPRPQIFRPHGQHLLRHSESGLRSGFGQPLCGGLQRQETALSELVALRDRRQQARPSGILAGFRHPDRGRGALVGVGRERRRRTSADGISNGVRRGCARWAAVISTFRRTPVRKRPASRAVPSVCTNGRAMPQFRSGRWSSISLLSGSGCGCCRCFRLRLRLASVQDTTG